MINILNYILGINSFHADSSATLIKDGNVIAAAEEERFNRIKHWSGFPEESIKFCLHKSNIDINDLDYITTNSNFYSNLHLKVYFSIKYFTLSSF